MYGCTRSLEFSSDAGNFLRYHSWVEEAQKRVCMKGLGGAQCSDGRFQCTLFGAVQRADDDDDDDDNNDDNNDDDDDDEHWTQRGCEVHGCPGSGPACTVLVSRRLWQPQSFHALRKNGIRLHSIMLALPAGL